MPATCNHCGLHRHAPTCPEMFWPDGKRRGAGVGLEMPPALTPKEIAAFQISNPGGESPIGAEMGSIFKGINESMVREHIERSRREYEASRGAPPDA
jgi:hypothetical protein